MYVELPEIQRCCCCVPARFGLLAWAYIKLMLSIITLCPLVYISMMFPLFEIMTITIGSVAILLLVVDVVINIVAVIGAHTKKVKLLKFYYKYCTFSLVLFIVVYVAIFLLNLHVVGFFRGYHPFVWTYVTWYAVVGLASFAVQMYMLLILRSVVNKLGSRSTFRFINHAAEEEAKCTMDIERAFAWNSPAECGKTSEDDDGLEVCDAQNRTADEDDWRRNDGSREKEGPEEINGKWQPDYNLP